MTQDRVQNSDEVYSKRKIAERLGVSRTSVIRLLRRSAKRWRQFVTNAGRASLFLRAPCRTEASQPSPSPQMF